MSEEENPSFDTPSCFGSYGYPNPPNNCETCKYDFICEKCTPKGLMKIIFKEETE